MTVFSRTYVVLIFLIPVSFLLALNVADNLFETVDRKEFMRNSLVEARLIEQHLDSHLVTRWSRLIEAYQPVFDSRISLVSAGDLATIPQLMDIDNTVTDNWMTRTASIDDWWLLHRLSDEYYLWIQEDERIEDIPVEEFLVILIPLLAILLLVAAAIGYISRRIARPLTALANTTNAIAETRLDARVKEERLEPLRTLTQRFNHMAGRIESLVREQQIMIGAIPHELRTPIARLRFALDLTRDQDDIGTLRKQIEIIDGYTDDIEQIIEQTLSLSRTIDRQPKRQEFNLEHLLETLAGGDNISDKSVRWHCSCEHPAVGDPDLVMLAIRNLLNNAIHHAHRQIDVYGETTREGAFIITVDDDGPGIPQVQRKAVFIPFFRLDDSRSRRTGGMGLGLALVRLIADRIDGNIVVSNSPLGGARFVFSRGNHRATGETG